MVAEAAPRTRGPTPSTRCPLTETTAGVERERPPELSEIERDALHEVELEVENLHPAHGHRVSFHQITGRAMDHLATAWWLLRECGYDDRVHEEVAAGWRYVAERRQEREWKRRAGYD